MLREEIIYEDALQIIEKCLNNEKVNEFALNVSVLMLKDVFMDIHRQRSIDERAKAIESWKEEIE